MVPAGNKAKRHSSVNHSTKTIHHRQYWQKQLVVVGLEMSNLLCIKVSCFCQGE